MELSKSKALFGWNRFFFINQMEFADLVEFMFGKIMCHSFFRPCFAMFCLAFLGVTTKQTDEFENVFSNGSFQGNPIQDATASPGIGPSTSRWHHPLWHWAGQRKSVVSSKMMANGIPDLS